MKNLLTILSISLLLFSTSCSKDEASSASISLSIEAIASNDTTSKKYETTSKTTSSTIVISEATMAIEKIELKQETETETSEIEIEYDFDGPYIIDLINGTSTPSLGEVSFEPGIYNKFEAEIKEDLIEDVFSLVVKGTYENESGEVFDLIYENDNSFDIKIESETGFVVEENQVMNMLVVFDLPALFNAIDLDSAVVNSNNEIILNDDNNKDLADLLENFLEDIAKMEDEDDEDDD